MKTENQHRIQDEFSNFLNEMESVHDRTEDKKRVRETLITGKFGQVSILFDWYDFACPRTYIRMSL